MEIALFEENASKLIMIKSYTCVNGSILYLIKDVSNYVAQGYHLVAQGCHNYRETPEALSCHMSDKNGSLV